MPEFSQNRAEEKTNVHHGVPRSFLGSSDRHANLTRVAVREHNAFHKMAGHRPPASFIRRTLLSSINWHDESGKMLPEGLYRDMLSQLTPHDWRTMYRENAIREKGKKGADDGYTKAAVHVHLDVWSKQEIAAEAIGALSVCRYMKTDVCDFRNGVMLFFKTDSPVDALKLYLTDANREGRRKWTRPLRQGLHTNLCDIVKNTRLEHMSATSRTKLLYTLNDHHEQLKERAGTWHPVLSNSIEALAAFGQARMSHFLRKAGIELQQE